MKINFHLSSRTLSQVLAILIIVLFQLPTISLAFDFRNLTYSGLNLFSVPGVSNTGSTADPAMLTVFTNNTSFTVTDRAGASPVPPGVASLYPSPIVVGAMAGTITDVNVTLSGITVGRPRDLDILLVAPGGQTLVLVADVGGTAGCGVAGINITLDDGAAIQLPNHDVSGCPPGVPITSGTYRPTNYASGSAGDTDVFPAPAPGGVHNDAAPEGASTLASVFNGLNPNGTWNLYVADDALGNTGTTTFAGGWSIDITTAGGIDPTTTGIVSSLNPSIVGQSVTFTSTTTNSTTGLPVTTGTVSFTQQSIAIAGCTGLSVNVSGQAACTTAALAEGTRTIQAVYSGTATLGTSNGSLNQVINSPTVATGAQFCNNGGLSFPDSGTTAPVYPSNVTASNMFGTISTVTATINGFNVPRPSNIDLMLVGPTGAAFEMMSDAGDVVNPANVNLVLADSAGTPLGTGVLASGTFRPTDHIEVDTFPAPAPAGAAQAAPTGAATFTTTFGGTNPNGNWSLFALDDGPGGGAGAIGSWCVTFTVTPFATTTTVTSNADPSVFGQPVTFTATVTSAGGTPSGNVQFREDGSPIGAPVALNGSGVATLMTSALPVGSHVITADYVGVSLGVGGGGFAASTGSMTGNPQVVNQASTTTGIASSQNPSTTGTPITFTVTVNPVAPGAGTRTGTVDVLRDGQVICNDVAINGSGQATCNMTFTVAFNYNITATYSGDGNFLGSSTAAPLVQMVSGPTAAHASVSGRVLDLNGRGVYGARVALQNQEGNTVFTITNPFGYYRFVSVASGQSYIVSVVHKRYQFEPRALNVVEDIGDVDFIPISGSELGGSDRGVKRPIRRSP